VPFSVSLIKHLRVKKKLIKHLSSIKSKSSY